MAEKFAVEGKCPECGGELNYTGDDLDSDEIVRNAICVNCGKNMSEHCKPVHVETHVYDDNHQFDFYPAAPTEPSATLEWAREVYKYCDENPLRMGDISGWLARLEQLLAAAPVEVKGEQDD